MGLEVIEVHLQKRMHINYSIAEHGYVLNKKEIIVDGPSKIAVFPPIF